MILIKANVSFRAKNVISFISDNIRHHEWNELRICFHNFCNLNKQNHIRNLIVIPQCCKVSNQQSLKFQQRFCTHHLPKDANIFGDLGYNKYEKVEMDEEEMEEEKFVENEARVPRRLKPSSGQYASMIKSYIQKGELDNAVQVLQQVKKNRDKPTIYMYSLLIRAFAVQGKLEESFKLYNQMKTRQLQPNAAIYNSLFNACAESKNTPKALESLDKLRRYLYEKQFPLNETHYHTMVKAYSWHNCHLEAFEVLDEMVDKRMNITVTTYNCLLHAAIGDKEAGMRHALIIWHMMKERKVKPDIVTYTLFLRAIRDTKFGNVNVNDMFSALMMQMESPLPSSRRPNLLNNPPVISTLPVIIEKSRGDNKAKIDPLVEEIENTIVLSPETKLDDIFLYNRLVLFGGFDNIIKLMEKDDVKPDSKVFTLLMQLLPNSVSAENAIIKYIRDKNIEIDIDFYNMLIKKRCCRKDYESAKAVLSEIQKSKLVPTIVTFGVLALGCRTPKSSKELLDAMEIAGYIPNETIVGTLIVNACHKFETQHVLKLMKYMEVNRIVPTQKLYGYLDKYQKHLQQLAESKRSYIIPKTKLKKASEIFQLEYTNWRQKFESS